MKGWVPRFRGFTVQLIPALTVKFFLLNSIQISPHYIRFMEQLLIKCGGCKSLHVLYHEFITMMTLYLLQWILGTWDT